MGAELAASGKERPCTLASEPFRRRRSGCSKSSPSATESFAFSDHEGFLGYRAYVDQGRGRLVGISLWTTRSALEASAETARRSLREAADLGATTMGEPEILELAFDLGPQL